MDQQVTIDHHQLQLPSFFTDSELLKLQIKQSAVPNAGLGLFSTKHILKGEYIAQYYGAIIPEKYSFTEPFLMEDKMVYLNKKYCVISRSPASRANDIVKWNPEQFMSPANESNRKQGKLTYIEGLTRNASIKLVEKDKAFLMASRDIQPGQEIYIDYGFQYWEFFFQKHMLHQQQQQQQQQE